MKAALRSFVRQRAGNCCEYCRIHQEHTPFALFHIEHVIPKKHGGNDDPSNLALACYHCNFHKGPNLTGIDPESSTLAPLFHPRKDKWEEHFERREVMIVGLTSVGRATIRVLNMNAAERVQLRTKLRVRRQLS